MEWLPLASPRLLLAWFVIANIFAFAAFGIDKSCAVAGKRRISEATLLSWAIAGGTLGAFAGRAHFRHKTRKQPFSDQLHFIAVSQVAALVGLAVSLWP